MICPPPRCTPPAPAPGTSRLAAPAAEGRRGGAGGRGVGCCHPAALSEAHPAAAAATPHGRPASHTALAACQSTAPAYPPGPWPSPAAVGAAPRAAPRPRAAAAWPPPSRLQRRCGVAAAAAGSGLSSALKEGGKLSRASPARAGAPGRPHASSGGRHSSPVSWLRASITPRFLNTACSFLDSAGLRGGRHTRPGSAAPATRCCTPAGLHRARERPPGRHSHPHPPSITHSPDHGSALGEEVGGDGQLGGLPAGGAAAALVRMECTL